MKAHPGWTIPDCQALTFMQIHLLLAEILREEKEAARRRGEHVDDDPDWDDGEPEEELTLGEFMTNQPGPRAPVTVSLSSIPSAPSDQEE